MILQISYYFWWIKPKSKILSHSKLHQVCFKSILAPFCTGSCHSPYIEQSFTKKPQCKTWFQPCKILGSYPQKGMSSRLLALLGSPPLKNQVHLLILRELKGGGAIPKRDTNLNSFSFEEKDPIFTRLKPGYLVKDYS